MVRGGVRRRVRGRTKHAIVGGSQKRFRAGTCAERAGDLSVTVRRSSVAVAAVLFLLSGFSALVYQVTWQRILGVFSGMHIYSITIIVTAFMAGLGFGSFFGGRFADKLGAATAVRAFAVCEVVIGLFALISPWLYYDVAYLQLGGWVRYAWVPPLVHLTLLFPPTFLMGASLPLLSKGLVASRQSAAATIGVLYGVNTLGAALGALIGVWFMLGSLGFTNSIRVGAALNILAAVGAVWLATRMPSTQRGPAGSTAPATEPRAESSGQDDAAVGESSPAPLSVTTWALIYGLSGFIALSLELLWFRILDVAIKSSPYTFGHLLGTFLLFLAIGSLAGARLVRWGRRPDLVFFRAQWGITVSSALAIVALARWPLAWWPLRGLFAFWESDSGIVFSELVEAWNGPDDPRGLVRLGVTIYGLLPLTLLAVPTFLMGLSFAFLQRAVQTDLQAIGRRVGLIQTANIVGSILGSFLTGTLFLGWFGTAVSLRLLVFAGIGFGLIAAWRSARPLPAAFLTAGVTLLLVVALPPQHALWARLHGSAPESVLVAEDPSSIVVLQRLERERAVLRVNGTGHSVLPYGGPHTLLGCFPILIHPEPKDALVIGLGAGNTAWAAAASPSLERLDVYEIAQPEYTVLERFRRDADWFRFEAVDQLLSDRRVILHFADGRLALRTEPRSYDVIEADALEPYMAYSGNLYSKEFFQSAADSLKPGGLVVSYTPTERTRRTFAAAMPYVVHLWAPQYLSFMIGSNEPIDLDLRRALARLESPSVQGYFRRSNLNLQVLADMRNFFAQVQVLELTPENRTAYPFLDGEINTDLFPRDEFDKATPVEEAHAIAE